MLHSIHSGFRFVELFMAIMSLYTTVGVGVAPFASFVCL